MTTILAALRKDPAFKKARSLCESIAVKRFALAALAAELKAENYRVYIGGDIIGYASWADIIALAGGVEVRTAQEWAQVGEWVAEQKPQTTVYSRVSAAVRYARYIAAEKLLEVVDDETTYPTVQSVQQTLAQIAYGQIDYTPQRIIQTLIRIKSGGDKLLGLNGDLPAEIRADVTDGTRLIARALETMEGKSK